MCEEGLPMGTVDSPRAVGQFYSPSFREPAVDIVIQDANNNLWIFLTWWDSRSPQVT
ncbi:unnamed protein product [Nesidiocoris tenuis]|uniref:Uncharacterized protein n=1 Tax=Nesidiocoris tenuis TaxID=355587 RepID=A0A6H5GBQ2_9HEMI|nr:unnamed protein product [Nesidiocoris tenuis]